MDDPLREHENSPLDDAIGLSYYGREGDDIVMRLEPTHAALGYEDPPMLHGGTLATLVDTAGWYAVMAVAPATWVAVDLRSDFLRMADLSPLKVTARCLRAGRTLAVCNVEISPWDTPEKLTSVGRIQFIRTGDLEEGKQRVDAELASLRARLKADTLVIALSDKSEPNWRLGVLPSYKVNRGDKPLPVLLAELRAYLGEVYKAVSHPSLEGDDVLGLLATNRQVRGRKIIVSIDKDLRNIPGLLFNPMKEDLGVVKITEDAADYNHLMQVLTGDRTDGYTGLPGCGPVKAERILHSVPSGKRWAAVVAAYEGEGFTEADALVQARVARILRHGEYIIASGLVRLWKPN